MIPKPVDPAQPTVDTLLEGDVVPTVTEANAHALLFTGSPVFAAVVDVVPAIVVPLHEEMSAWVWNVVDPQPRRQSGVIG